MSNSHSSSSSSDSTDSRKESKPTKGKSKDIKAKKSPVEVIAVAEHYTTAPQPPKPPTNAGKRWDDKQEEFLLNHLKKTLSRVEVAESMGRTKRSIDYRLCLMAERDLEAMDFFGKNPDQTEGESVCESYCTSLDEVVKYRTYQNTRKEHRAAKILAKHNVDGLLRQLDDGLYIKVAAIPSTKSIKEQLQITELNRKIHYLQQSIEMLQVQLAKADGRQSDKSVSSQIKKSGKPKVKQSDKRSESHNREGFSTPGGIVHHGSEVEDDE